VVGTIFVASDLKDLSSQLLRYLGIAGLVLLASLLVALGLSSQLQRLVSEPILQLAQVARSVAHNKNYSVRAGKHGDDELGQLVDGFNEMLAQIQARDTALQLARDSLELRVEERTRELEHTHTQLVEASRQGGMAEIATNVLHNVGNVLNSVNVSAGLILDRLKKSKASSLARVVVLLREHAPDLGSFITHNSRGKHLPAFLAQLSEHLLAEKQASLRELDLLRRNVEHIKEIVAMQQNYARVGGVKEMVNPVDLVEDSLRLNGDALSRHHVEVIREFEKVPPMNLEKHKILQILVNLLRNAKYACDESARPDKQLTVRVADGDGRVRISVLDNGIGIPAENLNRIFNHGFTTKKDGHGFGLHSGALAAKEMGGSLTVRSDGPGQGAAFTLELPCPARETSHE
jgi:signal transduction histidine kinase